MFVQPDELKRCQELNHKTLMAARLFRLKCSIERCSEFMTVQATEDYRRLLARLYMAYELRYADTPGLPEEV